MTVSEAKKQQVALGQRYKCANKPGSNLRNLENYLCPLWKIKDYYAGSFDGAGYRINHIIERAENGTDDLANLQALCPMCHSYKTNVYAVGDPKSLYNPKTNARKRKYENNKYLIGKTTDEFGTNRIIIKKELALHLLKQIDDLNKNEVESLMEIIKNINDAKILNIITRLLNLTFCFGNKIDNQVIINKIKNDAEAEKILFG